MKKNIFILVASLWCVFMACAKVDFEIDPVYERAEITGVELYNQNLNRADQSASINSEAGTISIVLRGGEDITRLKMAVTASTGVTISPSMSAGLQDFSQPKTYTITSPNGTVTKQWTISVQ
ncbi:hypothetical protein [Olivibacter sitiensis]|uniref:hypothetical protein n=1 Tax=Olivibacter sitiensis TaxID=376470 RepID=UPI000483F04E|nr:hypothetical protein [Olivibacter sitiensis]